MADIPGKWAEQSLYDIETAKAMLQSKRYLYVYFCCQQSVEKMLKGLATQNSGRNPPRTHNLVKLAESAGVPLEKETAQHLGRLSGYYIESRYPDELQLLEKEVDESHAEEMLKKTGEILIWLKSLLK